MHEVVANLLAQALASSDVRRRREAVSELWKFVEFHDRPSVPADDPSFYERWVRAELRSLEMDDELRRAIVGEVCDLLRRGESEGVRDGLLATPSDLNPRIAAIPTLELLIDRPDGFTPEETRALLIAVENMLYAPDAEPRDPRSVSLAEFR